MKIKHIVLSLGLIFTLPVMATDATAEIEAPPTSQLKMVGEGKMSYLFWDIYNLKLYTASGKYEGKVLNTALEFNYLRDIEAIDLVNETENQWRELELDVHPEEAKWLEQLNELWPDITEGDQLIFFINDKGFSEFYYNSNYTGVIESVEFSDRFKQIWLSEDTTAPKVRRKLLGNTKK